MTDCASKSLLEETYRLLKERRVTLIDIMTGTGLNYYWLRKFASHEIKDPSVNSVQRLYEYLTGKRLINEQSDTRAETDPKNITQ